jgi:site-specific DNA-methyltransferase (cytosine-N4-specific)
VTVSLAYRTPFGEAWQGDSLELLAKLEDDSVNLVITSPPFALLRKKEYGNEEQHEYIDWLAEFAALVHRKLTYDGSFVLDLGGAYQRGTPTRSLYNFRIPIRFCDDLGFHLAEDFYWYNPAKLPSPIEWVNKRKVRVKDAVNTVWWFSKTEWPKADITKVLAPYSDRMKKLLENPEAFYKAKGRPSGHDIGMGFGKDNGGAIPSNLLQIPNTDSNGCYLRGCKTVGGKGHPARFPAKLPEFFIKMLTDPGDTVVDIFAGSNTSGLAAELLGRRWKAFELSREYLAASAFRFLDSAVRDDELKSIYTSISRGETVDLHNQYGLLGTIAAE